MHEYKQRIYGFIGICPMEVFTFMIFRQEGRLVMPYYYCACERPKIVILKVGLLRVNNAHHGISIIGIVEG